jgi:hypothetical protein
MQQKQSRSRDPRGTRQQLPERPARAGNGEPKEIGGRPGPDPTRFGDWEKNGRCVDF